MPRLVKSVPRYRKHGASGQAIVTLDGHDFYLGPHGSKTSINEYDRLIAEWLDGGRRLPREMSRLPRQHARLVDVWLDALRHTQS